MDGNQQEEEYKTDWSEENDTYLFYFHHVYSGLRDFQGNSFWQESVPTNPSYTPLPADFHPYLYVLPVAAKFHDPKDSKEFTFASEEAAKQEIYEIMDSCGIDLKKDFTCETYYLDHEILQQQEA